MVSLAARGWPSLAARKAQRGSDRLRVERRDKVETIVVTVAA
jgi:hypothetical protein